MDLQKDTKVKPKVDKEKPLAKKAKKVTKGKVTKQTSKDKKVTQSVTVNVSTSKGKGRARKTKVPDTTNLSNIAGRVPLVNTNVNNIPADKNVTADPIKYLESKDINPETKVAVKLKKGQNLYDVETEAQQGAFEAVPTAKGKGLAENVEGQTAIKVQVNKRQRKKKDNIQLEPVTQFVNVESAKNDKEPAFDTQAEGFEENTEEGMEVKSKRGRPKKYATKEEAKIAKQKQTEASKAKKELKSKGIALEGYAKGTIPAEEDANITHLLQPDISQLSKTAQRYLNENVFTETQQARALKKSRDIFLENEAVAKGEFNDASLGKLLSNQSATNNNPIVQSLNENVTEFPDSNNALAVAGASASYTVI